VSSLLAAACGGTELSTDAATDAAGAVEAGGDVDTSTSHDAATEAPTDSAPSATACIPGRSVACVGPGGCSSNQVCNGEGTGYGPCECAQTDASAPTLCVPGQSIACAGPGGCISNQVCNATGTAYGPCACTIDGSALLCVPGQSIACTGAGGCFSSQICEANGLAYGPCVCFGDGGSIECQTASDCENLLGPLAPVFITDCPPGSAAKPGGCGGISAYPLHYICVLGVCQTTYCG